MYDINILIVMTLTGFICGLSAGILTLYVKAAKEDLVRKIREEINDN